jgi:hypothetical protein
VNRATTAGILVLVAWLPIGADADAQVVTGTIIGAVTDESRAVLPGASATISSPALPGGPSSIVTDEQGRYRFAGLAPGSYTLKIVLSGFSEYNEDLRVTAGGTIERNVSLKVATVAESITVTGQSPVVDTRSASVSATATVEVMESLPTARTTITDYVQVMPGVAARNPGSYNEQVNILGSPNNETMYVHDGVQIHSPGLTGGDIDGVEEVQTTSVGPSAEFASAAGGVMNVVTKSGTNTFQGDVGTYWKSDRFQSRPTKLDCDCPDGETGFHMRDMRDFSAHVGGPLWRDRLWFFSGLFYYQFNYTEPGSYPPESPTNWWHRMNAKMTWQATETTRVGGTFKSEPWEGYTTGPTRSVTREASTFVTDVTGNLYAVDVNQIFGSATALTVRAGGVYGGTFTTSLTGDLTTPSRTDNLTGIVSQGVPQINRSSYRREGQSVKLERYVSRRRTTHTMRAGFQHDRVKTAYRASFTSGVQYYDFGGAPDYALFQDPFVRGAFWRRTGGWGEDQMTIGDRLTVSLGLRFDHQTAQSPDQAAIDATLQPTGGTIAGLGDLFTWNVWSPRVGVNVKLTSDGRTVLRGTYSRVYREIFTSEIEPLHPGIAPIVEARYDPATGRYSNIVSVTNSLANITIDRDIQAPQTDTFSIGVDRELLPQVALHVSYVSKESERLIGWRDIRGVYGQSTTTLPDGRTLTVYPLQNRASERLFQRTNPPGWFDSYRGFMIGLDRRMANRWRAQANLTFSRSHGLRLPGQLSANNGRDPNDITNATGRIKETDRPVMFNANATYDVPVIDLRVSAQYQDVSNIPFAPQASVVLPQGRRSINIEAPGAFRADRTRVLNVKFNKFLFQQGRRRLELFVNVNNLFQNKAPQGTPVIFGDPYFTFNYFSPNYGEPVAFVQPRHMYLGARVNF